MTRNYARRVHYKEMDKPLCGAHLAPDALFDEDIEKVTCKNCKTVFFAQLKIKEEYPWIEIRKNKVILHLEPEHSMEEEVCSMSGEDINTLVEKVLDFANG